MQVRDRGEAHQGINQDMSVGPETTRNRRANKDFANGEFKQYPSTETGKLSAHPDGTMNRAAEEVFRQYGYDEDMKGKTGDAGGLFGM
jgi:hypothetical protein